MRTFVRFAGYAFIVLLLLLAVAITFTVVPSARASLAAAGRSFP
jgi:hypothetical protein